MQHKFSSLTEFAEKRETLRGQIRGICRNKPELLYVALNEAVNNAFMHGYKRTDAGLVEVVIYQDQDEIVIKVSHEGQGLDRSRSARKKALISLEDHGRGLEIISKCADSYQYQGNGRELVMRKQIMARTD